MVYTLIQSARLNSVNQQAGLADVLARINEYAARELDVLLPWNRRTQTGDHIVAHAA